MSESETTDKGITFAELLDMLGVDDTLSDAGIEVMTLHLDNERVTKNQMKVAQEFKKEGSVVLGIGILPFCFVGERRVQESLLRAEALGKVADGLMLINKQSFMDVGGLQPEEVDSMVCDVGCEVEEGLRELLRPGTPEITPESLKEALKDCGSFMVTRGTGTGDARLAKAFMEAVRPELFPNLDLYTSRKAFIKMLVPQNEPLSERESTLFRELISGFSRPTDVIVSSTVSDTVEELTVVMLGISFDVKLPD